MTVQAQGNAGELALDIQQLSKTFTGTVALKDVALQLRAGEVHALMGHNGSGKSTLIKVLAGFHAPDPHASAEVRGVPIHLGDSSAARQAGLRFVHQDLGLVDTLDSADNLALGAGYVTGMGFSIRWRRQRALALAAVQTLGHSFDVRLPVKELSAAERTTLAIARALRDFTDVSVLALDEPTAAMPGPDVERLHRIIQRVRDSGVAVLYVSHHIDEVLSVADRVTVLRDGSVVATRPAASLSPKALVSLMTGSHSDERPPEPNPKSVQNRPVVLQLRSLSGRDLHDFDLSLHQGEIVGVAGLDGSGRDELCSAIFGGRARVGDVSVAGSELPAQRPDLAVAAGVGYAPANRATDGLIMSMTVRENLTLVDLKRYCRGPHLRRRRELSDVEGWRQRLGIRAPDVDTELTALSGGNQQKVVIGKWLRVGPKVLLLDEPTQGIDVAAKADLHTQIEQAAQDGTGILVCSSDEAELERLCDRVIVLRRGGIGATFSRPHIAASAIARECLAATHEGEGSNEHV